MTNEEAIGVLYDSLGGRQDGFQEAFYIAINSIQENTKLKAEIENSNRIISNMINEHECGIVGRNVEIINLKSEIEQLKATISKMETITAHEDDLK